MVYICFALRIYAFGLVFSYFIAPENENRRGSGAGFRFRSGPQVGVDLALIGGKKLLKKLSELINNSIKNKDSTYSIDKNLINSRI